MKKSVKSKGLILFAIISSVILMNLIAAACTDSDAKSFYKKGVANGVESVFGFKKANAEKTDYCINSKVLKEYACSNDRIVFENYVCENGCYNGACLIVAKPAAGFLQALGDFFSLKWLFREIVPLSEVETCTSQLDCESNPIKNVCDISLGICVQCADDGDCQNGMICNNLNNFCTECLTNDDCTDSARPVCDSNFDNYVCIPSDSSSCRAGSIFGTGEIDCNEFNTNPCRIFSTCELGMGLCIDPGSCSNRMGYCTFVNVADGTFCTITNPNDGTCQSGGCVSLGSPQLQMTTVELTYNSAQLSFSFSVAPSSPITFSVSVNPGAGVTVNPSSITVPLSGSSDIVSLTGLIAETTYSVELNSPETGILRFDITTPSGPPIPVCGNNLVEPPEECDDGNTVSGDGCSSICEVEVTTPVCGDGIIFTGNPPEECDKGGINHENPPEDLGGITCNDATNGERPNGILHCSEDCYGFDTSQCTANPVCGNGIIESPETCDDGNTVSGDGCQYDCTLPGCYEVCLDRENFGCANSLTCSGVDEFTDIGLCKNPQCLGEVTCQCPSPPTPPGGGGGGGGGTPNPCKGKNDGDSCGTCKVCKKLSSTSSTLSCEADEDGLKTDITPPICCYNGGKITELIDKQKYDELCGEEEEKCVWRITAGCFDVSSNSESSANDVEASQTQTSSPSASESNGNSFQPYVTSADLMGVLDKYYNDANSQRYKDKEALIKLVQALDPSSPNFNDNKNAIVDTLDKFLNSEKNQQILSLYDLGKIKEIRDRINNAKMSSLPSFSLFGSSDSSLNSDLQLVADTLNAPCIYYSLTLGEKIPPIDVSMVEGKRCMIEDSGAGKLGICKEGYCRNYGILERMASLFASNNKGISGNVVAEGDEVMKVTKSSPRSNDKKLYINVPRSVLSEENRVGNVQIIQKDYPLYDENGKTWWISDKDYQKYNKVEVSLDGKNYISVSIDDLAGKNNEFNNQKDYDVKDRNGDTWWISYGDYESYTKNNNDCVITIIEKKPLSDSCEQFYEANKQTIDKIKVELDNKEPIEIVEATRVSDSSISVIDNNQKASVFKGLLIESKDENHKPDNNNNYVRVSVVEENKDEGTSTLKYYWIREDSWNLFRRIRSQSSTKLSCGEYIYLPRNQKTLIAARNPLEENKIQLLDCSKKLVTEKMTTEEFEQMLKDNGVTPGEILMLEKKLQPCNPECPGLDSSSSTMQKPTITLPVSMAQEVLNKLPQVVLNWVIKAKGGAGDAVKIPVQMSWSFFTKIPGIDPMLYTVKSAQYCMNSYGQWVATNQENILKRFFVPSVFCGMMSEENMQFTTKTCQMKLNNGVPEYFTQNELTVTNEDNQVIGGFEADIPTKPDDCCGCNPGDLKFVTEKIYAEIFNKNKYPNPNDMKEQSDAKYNKAICLDDKKFTQKKNTVQVFRSTKTGEVTTGGSVTQVVTVQRKPAENDINTMIKEIVSSDSEVPIYIAYDKDSKNYYIIEEVSYEEIADENSAEYPDKSQIANLIGNEDTIKNRLVSAYVEEGYAVNEAKELAELVIKDAVQESIA